MVPAKRPTDSILGHFRQVHGQLLEHVHYIYLIDLSRLFFDDSLGCEPRGRHDAA